MTILRWLLSHLVLLIVVATLVFAWLRWDDLQGWVPEPVNRVVAQLREELGTSSHETGVPAAEEEMGATDARLPALTDSSSTGRSAESASVPAPVEEPMAPVSEPGLPPAAEAVNGGGRPAEPEGETRALNEEVQMPAPSSATVSEDSSESIPMDTAASAEPAGADQSAVPQGQPGLAEGEAPLAQAAAAENVPAEAENAVSSPAESGPVAPSTEPALDRTNTAERNMSGPVAAQSFEALLARAREAFWHRDLQASVVAYRELTRMAPDNPDIWGELGNVLFAANDMPGAAEAYSRAAELLLAAGRSEDVLPLLPIIQRFSPDKARALQQRLRAPMPRG